MPFSQPEGKGNTFLPAGKACCCWLQNRHGRAKFDSARFEGLHPWKQDVRGKKWKNKTPVRTTGKDEEIKSSHNAAL